jgi:hypothetical protein
MTLRIDISGALNTHDGRAALVRAVVAAQPEDELDWIEWKIAGDLSKGWTQGTIARHILGMATRLGRRRCCGWRTSGRCSRCGCGWRLGRPGGTGRGGGAASGRSAPRWLGSFHLALSRISGR